MVALFLLGIIAGVHAATLDLSQAMVVSPPDSSGPERKAVAMLVDEVAARAQIRWPAETSWPASDQPVIAVGPIKSAGQWAGRFTAAFSARQSAGPAEGFRIDIKTDKGAPAVFVLGNDSRGILFGVGQLLRSLRMNSGSITLPADFKIASAPRYQLRGHQLGYRPKTHSYDAWDLKIWEQYIRDLAIFGCNAVELIPPRSDDAEISPHFPLPPLEMLRGMSRLLDGAAIPATRGRNY